MEFDSSPRSFWATLDHAEREDREVERNVRPPPKTKPPRHDLQRHRIEDTDPDVGEEDPDLSLNYKVVGSRRVQRDEKQKRPGDYWQADSAWGVWPPDADHPTSATDEERAKAIADGEDPDEDYDDDDDESPEDRDDDPSEEDREEARQKRLDQVREQFWDTLKTDLSGEEHPYVSALLDLPDDDFDLAMREFGDRVNSIAQQVAKKNFGWVANEANRAVSTWRGTPNPQQLGASVTAIAVMDSLVSDPERLAGVPLHSSLSDKALARSSRASFGIYRQAHKQQRQTALARSAVLLQGMAEDDPRRANLEARIDGLALACYLEGEDPVAQVSKDGQKPCNAEQKSCREVRLRPEMSPSFGKLVKVMAKAGRAEAMLVPPDDFFGPSGRSAVSHALQEADNEDLADLVKDGPFEGLGDLLRGGEEGPRLGAGQKAVLRDAVRRVVLEDATTVQAVLNATTKKSNRRQHRVSAKDLRARAAQKARRDEKIRSATKDLLLNLRGNPPDEAAVEEAVSNLILAGMKSLDELLQQLFDSGDVDPLPLDDPHLAKVRHAIKTGDLTVLWKKVVDPDSIRPLSGPPAQEDSSMSQAKRPAPPAQKKATTLPPIVLQARRKLAAQIDQCVMALQQNQADLGIASGAVNAFTQVADKVADHLDGGEPSTAAVATQSPPPAPVAAPATPAVTPTAQARQAAQRRQAMTDWDPENIGREVSGPLEDLTPDDTTFTGEFTQQENRELGDDYEAGKLDPNKVTPEPRAPRPGIQASVEGLRQLEAQVRTLRKSLQAGILAPGAEQQARITEASRLASAALRKQVQNKGK